VLGVGGAPSQDRQIVRQARGKARKATLQAQVDRCGE
jgi:hypothetical protein